jgi:nucleoside-diphosphate-sugar epimerase
MIAGMRILVVGGSGYVGSLVTPLLAERHSVRVFDLRPPAIECEYVSGDATDHTALAGAMDRIDAVLHCAMGSREWVEPLDVSRSFDVNVKSVHLTLLAAHATGVPHAVHISSMSVYRDLLERRIDDESVPSDATDPYGLTKRLAELVCQAAVAEWGLSVNVLRLTWPTADRIWPDWGLGGSPRPLRTAAGIRIHATAATDLARAVSAALELRDGYQIFTISGDRALRLWGTAKARERLGWEPTFGIST